MKYLVKKITKLHHVILHTCSPKKVQKNDSADLTEFTGMADTIGENTLFQETITISQNPHHLSASVVGIEAVDT